ncbi:MAG: hypothetical protein BYD32DRAFT_418304 [Podila humilis]|nr:MAG: hypothetical protein BYD32DRAFT_418304 [Podila humilis]
MSFPSFFYPHIHTHAPTPSPCHHPCIPPFAIPKVHPVHDPTHSPRLDSLILSFFLIPGPDKYAFSPFLSLSSRNKHTSYSIIANGPLPRQPTRAHLFIFFVF